LEDLDILRHYKNISVYSMECVGEKFVIKFICGRSENKLPTSEFILNCALPKIYDERGLT